MMPSLFKTLLPLLALSIRAWAQDAPSAKPEAANPPAKVEPVAPGKLLTQYFRVAGAVWTPDDGQADAFPVIQDGTEADPYTRMRNVQRYFSTRGVEFPPGSSAIYHEGPAMICVTNTAEQIKKVAERLDAVFGANSRLLQLRAHIVEFRPELEDQLAGRSTFAALQTKLGEGLKTICVSTVTTKSGNRVYGELDRGTPPPKTTKGGKAARNLEESPEWPPPPNVERAIFEVEPQIGPAGSESAVDMNFSFRYSAPAMGNRPALSTNFASNITLRPGVIFKARTFTLADPKQDAPRYFAILLQCELIDDKGKTAMEARDELFRKEP